MNRPLFLFTTVAALVLCAGCAAETDDMDAEAAPLALAAATPTGASDTAPTRTIPANYKQFFSFSGVAGEGYRLELAAQTTLALSVTAPGITINSSGKSVRINRFSPGSDGKVQLTVTNNTNAEQTFTLKVTRVP